MAENGIQLNIGTGGKIVDTETSPSSGFEIQRVKIAVGAVGADGGDVSSANALPVAQAGSTGLDFSANRPTLPNVGANFGSAGPYANYYLTATIPAGMRNNGHVENNSGAQIAVVRDDGTAAGGTQPAHASVFPLAGGVAGGQGAGYDGLTFDGRLQIYSALTTAITFTSALTAATSGTLTAAWTGPSGSVYVTFSTGSVQLASFTNGSTAVSWPSAVTATAAANAATAQIAAWTE